VIRIEIPGRPTLQIQHLVLDLNGTLAVDGQVVPPVLERLRRLSDRLDTHVVTADTFGTADTLRGLGATIVRLPPGDQVAAKAEAVRALGSEHTMAMGNGMNDAAMLREAILGVVILGREGAALPALLAADLAVASIEDGLDLLLHPQRLVASLRTE
jgi:soluble P-type ATPase